MAPAETIASMLETQHCYRSDTAQGNFANWQAPPITKGYLNRCLKLKPSLIQGGPVGRYISLKVQLYLQWDQNLEGNVAFLSGNTAFSEVYSKAH